MRYVFLRFPEFRNKALTLSYDDGVIFDKKLIEIMQKNKLRGTFNINSSLMQGERRLNEEQAKELYLQDGIEVAVHGRRHLSLAEVPTPIAVEDVITDRVNLERIFGKIVNGMAYANGSYNDDVVRILKDCGIKYSRTCITTEKFDIPTDWLRLPTTCHHKNPRLMELAKKFLEPYTSNYYMCQTPRLFYLWGHSYEFNDNNNWNIIEEFAEFLGNREDVWYCTNSEVYDYVKAYESLIFTAERTMVYNPTQIDVYLHIGGIDILVKAGQTVPIK